jgi:FlaG/FlaF family flagellin (archaellin)
MTHKSILKNEDGVSISIGFILMFAVTVIVFTGVMLSFYSLSRYTEKSAMEESFKILGSGLANKITTVDTLVNVSASFGATVDSIEYEFRIPATIAGKTYSMNLTNTTFEIILESDNGALVGAPFSVSNNFTGRKFYGGAEDYIITYDKNNNKIFIDER